MHSGYKNEPNGSFLMTDTKQHKWMTDDGDFSLKSINEEPIILTRIYACKNSWHMSGTMFNGRISISASNNGEYRCGFEYNINQPLMIKDIDWVRLNVTLIGQDDEEDIPLFDRI